MYGACVDDKTTSFSWGGEYHCGIRTGFILSDDATNIDWVLNDTNIVIQLISILVSFLALGNGD